MVSEDVEVIIGGVFVLLDRKNAAGIMDES
jgi:hypothetical protein